MKTLVSPSRMVETPRLQGEGSLVSRRKGPFQDLQEKYFHFVECLKMCAWGTVRGIIHIREIERGLTYLLH
jgi:hypothetical protein